MTEPAHGRTVRDLAAYYRVSEDKIRRWISSGELRAINTAGTLCGKPRWVIPPDAQADFERRRAGAPPPKPPRRKRRPDVIDFYPD